MESTFLNSKNQTNYVKLFSRIIICLVIFGFQHYAQELINFFINYQKEIAYNIFDKQKDKNV